MAEGSDILKGDKNQLHDFLRKGSNAIDSTS
jgi:hypothetical protein